MLHGGTLLKRRDHLPGWRPRHFSIQGSPDYMLLYYLPSTHPHSHHRHSHPHPHPHPHAPALPPRGLLPLGGASVRPLSEEEAGGVRHAFRVDHPWAPGISRSKGWLLAARSRQERDKWVRALKRAIAEAEAALRKEEEEEEEEEEEQEQQEKQGEEQSPQTQQRRRRRAKEAGAVPERDGEEEGEGEGEGAVNGGTMELGPAASVPLEQLVLPVSVAVAD
jgi:hypothetical protein